MKVSRILTAIALLMTKTLGGPTGTGPQTDIAILNTQLSQAVYTQDWGEAVKIVDQMIATTSSSNQIQHKKLEVFRVRMQSLFALDARK